jgi:ribosome-binding factor A
MPNFDRTARISEEVRKAIDKAIREEIRDPRITGTWSIVRCEVTRDLKYCKARISVLEEQNAPNFMKALKSAAGFIRREVGRNVQLRYTPELIFELDQNIAYAAKVNQILSDTKVSENDGDDN